MRKTNRFTGGGGGNLTNVFKTTSEKLINNKKVLVFSPYFPPIFDYNAKMASAKTKLEVTQVTGLQATLEIVNTFKDYGLVVINTHGLPQGFQIKTKEDVLNTPVPPDGTTFTEEQIKAFVTEANGLPLEKFLHNELAFVSVISYYPKANKILAFTDVLVRDKYIRNLPKMLDAVVFGNFCYSGYTASGPNLHNVPEAFKSIGAVAYYGYSFTDGTATIVPNPWAHYMEDSLITSLIGGDSTGIAHLANNTTLQTIEGSPRGVLAAEEVEAKLNEIDRGSLVFKPVTTPVILDFAFRHYFDPRYKYGCGTFTDPRDSQTYKLACIGDKKWFAENLRYNAPGSRFYDDNPANGPLYGKLYTFSMMMAGAGPVSPTQQGPRGICPEGWHVPSLKDFTELRTALIAANGSADLGVQLKARNNAWLNDPTLSSPLRDVSGMTFLPAGALDQTGTSSFFWGKGETAEFFLASPYSSTTPGETAIIYFQSSSPNIGVDEDLYEDDMLPCRCVMD